jgi:dTDP-4-amino-4,6-dideoxygalactose transaminase
LDLASLPEVDIATTSFVQQGIGVEEQEEEAYVACSMSNLEAGIALRQLRMYEKNALLRKQNAAMLLRSSDILAVHCISDLSPAGVMVKLVVVPPATGPAADSLIKTLARCGIECQSGYKPCHLEWKGSRVHLPNTEALWGRVVCIPVESRLKETEQHDLMKKIRMA